MPYKKRLHARFPPVSIFFPEFYLNLNFSNKFVIGSNKKNNANG